MYLSCLQNTLKVPYQQVTQKNLSSKFKRKTKAEKHLYGSDGTCGGGVTCVSVKKNFFLLKILNEKKLK